MSDLASAELQESFLRAMWTLNNSDRHLTPPEGEATHKVWTGGFMIPHDEKRYRRKRACRIDANFVYMRVVPLQLEMIVGLGVNH